MRSEAMLLLPMLLLLLLLDCAAGGSGCQQQSDCRPGRTCQLLSDGSSACDCAPPSFCRGRRAPVCGSDGKLYVSHCHLHRAACVSAVRIRPLPAAGIHNCYLLTANSTACRPRSLRRLAARRLCRRVAGDTCEPAMRADPRLLLLRLAASASAEAADAVPAACRRQMRGDGRSTVQLLAQALGVAPPAAKSPTAARLSAKFGDDVIIGCDIGMLGGREQILWSRNGNPMPASGAELRLANVEFADSGRYRCCSSLWPNLCRQFQLAVIAPPTVRVHPRLLVVREGDTATFHCDTGASVVSQLTWRAATRDDGDGLGADGGGYGMPLQLQLRNVSSSSTGVYTCRAENFAAAAEAAGSLYVRTDEETDASSFPVTRQPQWTRVCSFHSGGYSQSDAASCSVGRESSAEWDAALCENLLRCSWGAAAAAGRRLFVSQPRLGRLLSVDANSASGGGGGGWFRRRPLQLNCRPRLLSHCAGSDRLWVACGDSAVHWLPRASDRRLRTPRRLLPATRGASILALPSDHSPLIVQLLPAAVRVLRTDATEVLRWRLLHPVHAAHVLRYGGTLLLHSAANCSGRGSAGGGRLTALDLRTGRRLPNFAGIADDSAVCLFVSPRGDHILHTAGTNLYVHRVAPDGQPQLLLHDVADIGIRAVAFQSAPGGRTKILALTDRPGTLMTIDVERRSMQLTFDKRLEGKRRISVPNFGDLALVYSATSAVFFNSTSDAVTHCEEEMFLQLQTVHWLPD